eukprot:6175289-Pleurochrysis_carterae.AAC.2
MTRERSDAAASKSARSLDIQLERRFVTSVIMNQLFICTTSVRIFNHTSSRPNSRYEAAEPNCDFLVASRGAPSPSPPRCPLSSCPRRERCADGQPRAPDPSQSVHYEAVEYQLHSAALYLLTKAAKAVSVACIIMCTQSVSQSPRVKVLNKLRAFGSSKSANMSSYGSSGRASSRLDAVQSESGDVLVVVPPGKHANANFSPGLFEVCAWPFVVQARTSTDTLGRAYLKDSGHAPRR